MRICANRVGVAELRQVFRVLRRGNVEWHQGLACSWFLLRVQGL